MSCPTTTVSTSYPLQVSLSSTLDIFVVMMTASSLLLCFFSLLIFSHHSVDIHAKEIAMLRSIGAPPFLLFRVLMYETIILVLSASLMGSAIGGCTQSTQVPPLSLCSSHPLTDDRPSSPSLLHGNRCGCGVHNHPSASTVSSSPHGPHHPSWDSSRSSTLFWLVPPFHFPPNLLPALHLHKKKKNLHRGATTATKK